MSLSLANLIDEAMIRVKGVVQLDSRAGLASGGQASDPTLKGATLPCAWVIYAGDVSEEEDQVGTVVNVVHEVLVKVLTSYNTEADLKNISYPTLQLVVKAMTATVVEKTGCRRWKYEGQTLEEIDERLVYVQRYTISGNL